jgi:NifU-like protein
MAWEYSEKTKQLFMDAVHGKPGTHLGEIAEPDGVGEHGSIACGDAMRFTFRVERHPTDPRKDKIVEAKYLTFGCTSAIASSEALCAMIEERKCSPIEALQITNEDIVQYLEGLPTQKIHCSVMGAEALEAAVFNWAQKRGVSTDELGIEPVVHEEDEGRVVCKCFSLTEPYLRRKIKELHLKSIPEITNAVKAGGACMACHHAPGGLQDLLDDTWGKQAGTDSESSPLVPREPAPRTEGELSPYQFAKKVERVVEEYVRPMLQRDGGDVEIVDIKERLVYCQLVGACHGCAGASMTLKLMIEKTLKEQVDDRIRVIAL